MQLPLLQPLAQVVSTSVYVQTPAVQLPGTWPARRVVAFTQTAACGEVQPEQAWPLAPHRLSFCPEAPTHWPFAVQQPFEQDEASHTQAPLLQRCPAAHARPVPQEHSPAVLQLSAVGPQAEQLWPAGPHASRPGVVQVLPTQQPTRQVDAQPLHAPLMHVSVPGQTEQLPPRAPHAIGVVPATHRFPSQHPLGHDAAVHEAPASEARPPPLEPPAALPPAAEPPACADPPAAEPPACTDPPAVAPPAAPPPAAEHEGRQRSSAQHCNPAGHGSPPSLHLKVVSFEVSTQTQPQKKPASTTTTARADLVTPRS
jgi:hypothetical protein